MPYMSIIAARWLAVMLRGPDIAAACCADPVYPPSLYKAISYASTLGVPVYILENGMPAKEDDSRRSDWINGCLNEVRRMRRLYCLCFPQSYCSSVLAKLCSELQRHRISQ